MKWYIFRTGMGSKSNNILEFIPRILEELHFI